VKFTYDKSILNLVPEQTIIIVLICFSMLCDYPYLQINWTKWRLGLPTVP